VRVVRMPPHLDAADYPHPEVQAAFKAALGKVFRVEGVDWGGWVFLQTKDGGIGVQPDCVELVEEILEPLD